MGDIIIHIDDTNDTLGLVFTDLLQSLRIKQNVICLNYCLNHTLDIILSDGTEGIDLDIIPQCDDVTVII